ncbi:MAG: 3-hydroxyacyl-ACP dehydratase FabZ family protein [Planctomycetota bacterium]
MPIELLADLQSLDLSRVIVTHEEFYSRLQHRGTFAVIDGVLYHDPEKSIIVGYKDITPDQWWCADHIPGRPIFPGVLMVEASAQLGTYEFYERRPETRNVFLGFTGINHTRFRAVVEPTCRLTFVGNLCRVRSNLFTYRSQAFVDKNLVFEGEVTGMVIG